MRSLLFQVPKITAAVSQEMALAEELVLKYDINRIISDHRLGFRVASCMSHIIAHQIQIQSSFGPFGNIGSRLNKYFINQFNECWIPDYKPINMSLAGNLSRPEGLKKYRYIGPLSRLQKKRTSQISDILLLLSGPEPRRTMLERQLLQILSRAQYKVILVRGTNEKIGSPYSNIEYFNVADTSTVENLVQESRLVIARSGYSTIMDLVHLRKKAILIPTTGQTEQEYLAKHLQNQEIFTFLTEDDLDNNLLTQVDQLLN